MAQLPPDKNTFDDMVRHWNNVSGEPRSTVLITHLYIEYLIDWIIRKKVKKAGRNYKVEIVLKIETR